MKHWRFFYLFIVFLVFASFVNVNEAFAKQKRLQGTSVQNKNIMESGMAADAEPQGSAISPGQLKVIDRKKVFKVTDEKAVWWCQYKPKGIYYHPTTLLVKWYSPDGNLYREEKIKSFTISEAVKAELPIKGTDVAKMLGKWRIAVYKYYAQDKSFDEVWFVIGEPKEELKKMGED